MWLDLARQALTALIRRPARSALTVLGLTIGVAAFIAMVAFGDGARESVDEQFSSLGTHLVSVRSRFGSSGALGRLAAPLSDVDVRALEKLLPAGTLVVPAIRKTLDVRGTVLSTRTMVQASPPSFFALRAWRAEQGGLILGSDAARRSAVCVLGNATAGKLFGDREALGQALRIGEGLHCNVVGVLEARGSSLAVSDQDDLVVLPVPTYVAALGFSEGYNTIDVRPPLAVSVATTRTAVTKILRENHQLDAADSDDFAVSSPDDVIRAAGRTSMLLRRLLAGVALVSLLVGGIGIMNILLVSVSERTQEIGIRAAIGAPPLVIMLQFMVEALVLSLTGAGLGAALGSVTAVLVADRMGWARAVSPGVVGVGLGFGVCVGLVFSILPARRAATLDPIAALRRE